MWEFDKRKVTSAEAVELLPRPTPLPEPFDPRWRLAGSRISGSGRGGRGSGGSGGWKKGKPVTRALYDSLREQVAEINASIDWIQEQEEKRKKQKQERGERR